MEKEFFTIFFKIILLITRIGPAGPLLIRLNKVVLYSQQLILLPPANCSVS